MSAPQSGRDSGGDLFDMAKDGTTVPEDSAKPRLIPSVPRPDQIASDNDPNSLGGSTLDEAATNATDIPRSTRDVSTAEVVTGTGDTLPGSIDSKRLHDTPGGVVHHPAAKGSTRTAAHRDQKGADVDLGASDGPNVDRAPGDEELNDDEAMDKVERKVDT